MITRRQLLRSTAGAMLSTQLPLAAGGTHAADTDATPQLVQLDSNIEPIVRLIEETPRNKCFDMIVDQLKQGLPYRQFLAALYLAGIRNVNPQPPGFKFHCVFVIHAAHQMSLDAPVHERLLPLLWALDNFKISQQQDVKEGDFRLGPVTGSLSKSGGTWDEFHAAMDAWDEQRADRAIVALARSRGTHEIIEQLWQYGARDYRNIGHKAIFLANTWRTLQTIGWQHAEVALRSLVLGLLDFGAAERVNDYAFDDQCFHPNLELAKQHQLGDKGPAPPEKGSPLGLFERIRSGDTEAACGMVADAAPYHGLQARPLWDIVHLAAGDLMMRQPGIYGIHTVTSVNGLHYAFETAADPRTRLLMLLQATGWMCQFRNFMEKKPQGLADVDITDITATDAPADPADAIDELFALIATDPAEAARRAATLVDHAESIKQRARQLIFRKGTDAHDYKYATAIFEDLRRVSPAWQPQMLATAVYHLRGSTLPDSPVMARATEALKRLR